MGSIPDSQAKRTRDFHRARHPGTNGAQHASTAPPPTEEKGESLADNLERTRKRTDKVVIISDQWERGPADETGSWEDVAKVIDGVRWLVPGWIPYRMLLGLVAEPKKGKSAFAIGALIRSIVLGCDWFTGAKGLGEPRNVVYCDTERSAAINIERMRKWGLPLDRVKTPFRDVHAVVDIDNAAHIQRIRDVVCYYEAPLVVVDSYRGAHKGEENNSKIAAGLQALGGLCEETGCACVVIHHTKKMAIDEDLTLNAARGSNAFLAAVRAQIAIDIPDPRPNLKEAWRRVMVLGENLGIAPQPLGFRISDKGLEFGEAPQRVRKVKEAGKVEEWLAPKLTPGAIVPVAEVLAEAEQYGFSKRTVQRVATEILDAQPTPKKQDGKVVGWEWVVPGAGE
jgi:hypothetical protein